MQKVFYGAKMGVTGEYSNTLRLTPVHTNTVMLCTFALASLLYNYDAVWCLVLLYTGNDRLAGHWVAPCYTLCVNNLK